MSKLDKDQVIADFSAAYETANGKAPTIEAKGGWYSVDGGKNIRLAALVDLTAELSGSPAKEKEVAAEKKKEVAKPKKDAVKKSVQKKPAAAKTKPKSNSGFSVKAFWTEQVENRNPGSRAPR